jgi:hypothetical protein
MYALPCPEPMTTRSLRVDAHPRVEQIAEMDTAKSLLVLVTPWLLIMLMLFVAPIELIDAVSRARCRSLQSKGDSVTVPPFPFKVNVRATRPDDDNVSDQSYPVIWQGVKPAWYALIGNQSLADGVQATRITP